MFKKYLAVFLSLVFFVQCKKKEPLFPELEISGASYLMGQQMHELSVTQVEGAIYTWQIPSNISIISGQGTWKIKLYVDPLFSKGEICVTVENKYESKQVCKDLLNSDDTINTAQVRFIGKVTKGRRSPFIFPLNNKLFFGTGYDTNSAALNDFYSLDPNTKLVSTLSSNGPLTFGRSGSTFFSAGNKGYFGFGVSEGLFSYENDFWEFDAQSMTWEQKSSNPALTYENSKSFVINNKAYIVGGSDLLSQSINLWEYDLSKNTWQQKKDLPYDCGIGCLAFSYDNIGYFISGAIGSASGGWILTYDPVTDEWTSFSDFPGPDRYNAFGFLIGSKYYYGGGVDDQKTYIDIWEWNIPSNVWTQKEDLPFNIRNCSSCSFNGKGYLFGGLYVSNKLIYFQNKVYEYSPD